MQPGMIGLERMGANQTRHLMRDGHEVVVFDVNAGCVRTVAAAVDVGVPANVLTAALYERFSSRGEADVGDQLVSAMRSEFGGRVEKAAAGAR
jgi:6-phosphogluconate dehydrogenase (decarboxylating)